MVSDWRDFDREFAPVIRNLACNAGLNEAEADEVVQETLIGVAKRIADFKHAGRRGAFRAWLYQQTKWRIIDQFRRRAWTQPDGARSDSGWATAAGPIDSASNADPTMGLHPELERLRDLEWEEYLRASSLLRLRQQVSARQFQLFDLHVLQRMPVRDAAKASGASVAAVYMAKSRLCRLLRRELKALQELSR